MVLNSKEPTYSENCNNYLSCWNCYLKMDGSADIRRSVAEDGRSMSVINRSEDDIFANAPSTSVAMACPAEKVGPLIGKKGIVVHEIMRRSLCIIYVD